MDLKWHDSLRLSLFFNLSQLALERNTLIFQQNQKLPVSHSALTQWLGILTLGLTAKSRPALGSPLEQTYA